MNASVARTELLAAHDTVAQLAAVLDAEFAALKAKDAELVESLQAEKAAALDQIAQWVSLRRSVGALDPDWSLVVERVAQCQDEHRRNEYLARCQLEAVHNTLAVLHSDNASNSVDLYDRMGRVSRRWGARAYGAV